MRSGGNNFNFFSKISRPNWQISCRFYVCLCFVWRIGGLAPSPPFGYATGQIWQL